MEKETSNAALRRIRNAKQLLERMKKNREKANRLTDEMQKKLDDILNNHEPETSK
jgi:hypothetical protein|tara:strand:+ start:2181 stop:2345 length:165 start_codon:yes stop_codon:yes gene_type:complete